MKQLLIRVASIYLAIVIAMSVFGVFAGMFLKATFFSQKYYQESIISSNYLKLVRASIDEDLKNQSEYVGIPEAVLIAGVDDAKVYLLISQHLQQVSDFANYRADYTAISYLADGFNEQLTLYIKEYSAKEGFNPTSDQMKQLSAVAADSAAIVSIHINLLDLNLVKDQPIFQRLHELAFRLAGMNGLFVAIGLVSILLLIVMHRRNWHTWLLYTFISTWFASSMVLVPTAILAVFGLTRRLAISTGYLKLAVDQLLSNANQFLIVWSTFVFVLSTLYLLIHLLVIKSHHKKSKRHDRQNSDFQSDQSGCQIETSNV